MLLTVCQPYAEKIARGEKPIENRNWPTSYRGLLAVHAGKSRAWLDEDDEREYPDMAYGAIVAVADLVDCVRVDHLPSDLLDNDHAIGPWCWVLANVRGLTQPIPFRGALGLVRLGPDIISAIQAQIEKG